VKRLAATFATIGRIALPYFRSEDRWPGRILLGSVIGLELSVVAIHVILNYWYNGFYNTLQDRNWSGFVQYILFFCVLATIYTVVVVYQNYLNLWLQIRWRRWMTQTYLRQWLNTANHYRMQLLGDAADNPDQRIADDLQMFVQETLSIGIGLLNSVVTLCSFVFILWNLSEKMPLHLFGVDIAIPGYLIWGALVYAVIGTVLTHLIGWPLIPLNFQRQRFEADFRFNLVRTRENSEQVAALRGEAAERERHIDRFSRIVANWIAIMQRQKKLMFFTRSYSQATTIFPYLMAGPAYFASAAVQLGDLMQTGSAFHSVQNAMLYFVSAYQSIAQYQAVVKRLSGFEDAITAGRDAALTPPIVEVLPRAAGQCRAHRVVARRARAGDRTVGRGQVDAVSGHRRNLAVRIGPGDGAEGRHSDALAAAALFPRCLACRSGELSGAARHLRRCAAERSSQDGRPRRMGGPARGRSSLEPDAFARRTAAACNRARIASGA
jgi:putative ATP-binding cassette transporter